MYITQKKEKRKNKLYKTELLKIHCCEQNADAIIVNFSS